MTYLITETQPAKGFHPTSTSTIHLSPPSSSYTSCSLYLYYTLPPLVFIDTHELAQRTVQYKFSHWGSRDLEKPSYALPDEPSELLVQVPMPWSEGNDDRGDWDWDDEDGGEITVEVPMHLRYGSPRSTRSAGANNATEAYEEIKVNWPQTFLLCPSTTSLRAKMSQPPLPAHILGAIPSGKPRTKHLIPIPAHTNYTETFSTLLLPVGDTSDLAFVEPLTALTVLLCFLWLFKVSWRTASRIDAGTEIQQKKRVD